MKTKILLALVLFTTSLLMEGQPPQAFKYQAVVRNASSEIISNEAVDVRISIIDGWAVGPVIYQETHSTITNQFGIINLSIGWGTPGLGYDFLNIDWRLNEKFIEVEILDDAGTTWISMGASMLFSVPYALYAKDDGNWIRDGNDILAANTGHVGIGAPSLFYKLNVSSSGSMAIRGEGNDYTGISGSTSGYLSSGVIGSGLGADSRGVYGYCPNGGDAIVGYSPLGWAGYFDGHVYTSGYLGIGTTSPNANLHVNDRIRIGEDQTYPSVYGELIHEGTNTGFRLNANSGTSWAYMLFQTDNNTRMAIKHNGRVGINTTDPVSRLDIRSEGSEMALYAGSLTGTGINASSGSGYALFAVSSGWAGYFSGDVNVGGTLSKGAGSFVIDHPLDPENKLLRHNFMESPENLVVYRGKAKLNSNGETVVELPEYFEALTKENEATVTLTSIGKPFLTGYNWENDFNSFKVYGEPDREVSWVVYADRDDPVIHKLGRPVEEDKGPENKLCEKGKLLYPDAYGYPESLGRDYDELSKMKNQNNNSQ